ncbi:MAG: hypothetical protein KGP08_10545 [Xanthomonadaceae bacterium]|nr:hypothetical protein [Xanthomonadaceae bacterium]
MPQNPLAGESVRVLLILVLMLPGLLLSGPLYAASIEGHLALTAEGKPLRSEEAQDAIVYFRPKVPTHVLPAHETYTMSTLRKQFTPRTLAIIVGSKVRFPNDDPILHNAFSLSKDNAFDVGLYGEGVGKTVTFSHVGYVRVYCNVHHSMVGSILVLDTPYFTHPDASGTFRLAGVPAVEGDLVIWHERAPAWHVVTKPGDADKPLDVHLELTQRRIPPHMNKFGKPYGRDPNRGY